MDHPNIAAVFDAGSTDNGRPYFVMEYVDGVSITDYCDRERLSTRDRLALFVQVCAAVQHAHQKGVIHRDLKPSNVLVTERDGHALPKVIDFGTAKAVGGAWNATATQGGQGMVLGTLEYMSPEQAALSADIDTATDVYSPRRPALRAARRPAPVRYGRASGGRLRRNPARHSRIGSTEAERPR